MRSFALAPALAIACLALPAAAEPRPVRELAHDVEVDGPITTAGLFAWITTEAAKSGLAPTRCHWCESDASGQLTVGGLDRDAREALRWGDTKAAAVLSDVSLFVVTPLAVGSLVVGSAANDGALAKAPVDLLLVAEATVTAAGLNQLVKMSVGRERPFVAARSPEEKAKERDPDDNLSFFSGHTATLFAMAVSAGTVTTMRGYRLAPVVWATGIPLAFATGWLRIAADKHWLSDVVTGALVGSALGAAIPLLFHRPVRVLGTRAELAPLGAGAQVVVRF
jgi:membrane-associated phospholipid phosphatase